MHPSVIALITLFVLSLAIAMGMVGISSLLGKKTRSKGHLLPYECGLDPIGTARHRMPVRFFLIAVLFILFDIEVVFLYPWAVVFRDFVRQGQGVVMFIEMAVFLGVLLIGFVYVWRRGALEWEA